MATRFLCGVALVAIVIVIVDYFLGETAEYLNAYEILRRSGLSFLPHGSERFVFAQERLGSAALFVGWVAWACEAALTTALLFGMWRALEVLT